MQCCIVYTYSGQIPTISIENLLQRDCGPLRREPEPSEAHHLQPGHSRLPSQPRSLVRPAHPRPHDRKQAGKRAGVPA